MSTVVPVAATLTGKVQGIERDGAFAFRGIPYAAAPFGPRRLRPPEPPEPWDGVRDATRYGATVPKAQYPPPTNQWLRDPEIPGDECLNLNVWTPDPSTATRLPVFVWIHGGAFTNGAGSIPTYNCTRFARDGVVGVTINYRLGVDGFLATGDGIANCGLLDMVAALEWVRDNIAAFGGDPDEVTIAGESAGAAAVYALMAMPRAQGLFRRAIAQSAGPISQTPENAQRVAAWLARSLEIEPTRHAFASVPIEQLVLAQQELSQASRGRRYRADDWGEEGPPPLPFAPVADGDVLPAPTAELLAAGASRDVALLAGSNTDEELLFFAPAGLVDKVDEDGLAAGARALGLGDDDVRVYRKARPDASPGELLVAIGTDGRFRIPAVKVAETRFGAPAPTYLYEFAWRSPAAGGILGACHALEIPFAFDNLDRGGLLAGEEPPQELADVVHGAWVAFVTGRDPGWPTYEAGRRATMTFDLPESRVVDDPRGAEREVWSR
jgi:para-nitrobenzyl esterase